MEGRKGVDMKKKGDCSRENGKRLLEFARIVIADKLGLDIDKNVRDRFFGKKYSDTEPFNLKRGVFVTLHLEGELRGCIGTLEPCETIWRGVQQNAVNSAFHDPRFPTLSVDEFHKIDIEISILSKPEKLVYSDVNDLVSKLKPGIDGVIIGKGMARATFLPQVWEQLPDVESFLTHLCIKAGLSPYEWKKGELDIKVYYVQYFNENTL